MFLGRKTNRRGANCAYVLSRFTLGLLFTGLTVSAGMLTDCVEASYPSAEIEDPSQVASQNKYWSFPVSAGEDTSREFSILVPLPPVEKAAQIPTKSNEPLIARLLPPQPLVAESIPPAEPHLPTLFLPVEKISSAPDLTEITTEMLAPIETLSQPVLAKLTEQQRLLAALSRDSSSAVTGVLTDSRVNELAKTKIQQAYAMAGRGSQYVARQKLIEALRMISQAKDAQQGTPDRTVALAAGLRALREAEDFAPRGTQLEAELDIKVLCASHRTPIANQADSANLLPRLMMDRYLRYAQLQLALSVAGEPAGSMALHALGKLNSQLGRLEPEKNRLAERKAIAYQQAALLAHNQNFLAAHELGVLLATSGHFVESQQLLLLVAAREPNAVVYRNLARVQEKLGQRTQALANRDHARQLSQQGATGTNNVQWVSPNQFLQGGTQIPRYTTAKRPPANRVVIPGSRVRRQ